MKLSSLTQTNIRYMAISLFLCLLCISGSLSFAWSSRKNFLFFQFTFHYCHSRWPKTHWQQPDKGQIWRIVFKFATGMHFGNFYSLVSLYACSEIEWFLYGNISVCLISVTSVFFLLILNDLFSANLDIFLPH